MTPIKNRTFLLILLSCLFLTGCSLFSKDITFYVGFVDELYGGFQIISVEYDGEELPPGELSKIDDSFQPGSNEAFLIYTSEFVMEGAQSDGDTSDTDYTIDEHANGIYFLIYGNTSETFSSLSEMNSRAEELGFSPFSDDNSDDNSGSVSGSYSIDGVVTGSFTSAQKEDNGSNSDSYDWDFYLYTGTLTNYAYEGNGDYFVMDLNTPDQSNFNGTYTKDSTRDALTWPLITLYTGVQGGFGYENEYNISSGQVVISESNDSFTISFSLTAFTGEIISGSYTGPVPDM